MLNISAKTKAVGTLLCTAICAMFFGCTGPENPPQTSEFPDTRPTAVFTRIILAEDTPMQTTLYKAEGDSSGPVIFILAGVHGDETAGIRALERMLEKGFPEPHGTLYILPRANAYGEANDVRRTSDSRDLNRQFPGDPGGDDTKRYAAELYNIIRDAAPDIVLDLHEAHSADQKRDALGNSIIFYSTDGMAGLVEDIIFKTAAGELCSEPFGFYSGPPEGSLNRTLGVLEQIPVITVETLRSDDPEVRADNQTQIVMYTLEYFGVIAPQENER